MQTITELAAHLLLAEQAFAPAVPGLVGVELDVPGAVAGRRHLRHGFVAPRAAGVVTVSGPPSPGLEASIARMADDLRTAGVAGPAGGAGGIRIAVEAGPPGGGPLGLTRRWRLAHTLGPVLAGAFANSPGDGWRSRDKARHRDRPVLPPGADPRSAWADAVLDSPAGDSRTFRQWARTGTRPTLTDLAAHAGALRLPVTARGHLLLDVADAQPGDGWRVVVAVTTVLLDDPRAAAAAETATAGLAGEPRLWERAARDALTDPVLAGAARECFLAAYGALARQGVARDLRDQVAGFLERHVLPGRSPADHRQERSPVM